MIFPTAMMIGIAAGLTRSAIGIAGLSAGSIGLTFALAVAVSSGPINSAILVSAYGFNAGLIALLLVLVAIERRKTA